MRRRTAARVSSPVATRRVPVLTGNWGNGAGGQISTTGVAGRFRIAMASNSNTTVPAGVVGWTALHAGIVSDIGSPSGAARLFGRFTTAANEPIPQFGSSRMAAVEYSDVTPDFFSMLEGRVAMSNHEAGAPGDFVIPGVTLPDPSVVLVFSRVNSGFTLTFEAPVVSLYSNTSPPVLRVGHTVSVVSGYAGQTWGMTNTANRISATVALLGAFA